MFLNCPLNGQSDHIEMWFINLWNHFIIPYLTATTLDGIKVCEVYFLSLYSNIVINFTITFITVAIWSGCQSRMD